MSSDKEFSENNLQEAIEKLASIISRIKKLNEFLNNSASIESGFESRELQSVPAWAIKNSLNIADVKLDEAQKELQTAIDRTKQVFAKRYK
jgi:hypothetical protein